MNDSTLMSIKDFAKFTGVKQSKLRFYEEIGLIAPAERGEENNYRYYKPSQSMRLSFINVLIELGVPLATIKQMSDCRTPECVIELLSHQEFLLDQRLHELHTAYSIIHTFRKNIQTGLLSREEDIRVENLEDAHFVLGPVNDFSGTDTFYKPFMNFCNSANDYRINLRYPIGGYHYDIETFSAAPSQPNKFFSLDPLGNCTRGAGHYLVGYARGYYGQFGDLPERMAAYAGENDLVCNGPVYTLYLLDEVSMTESDQYLARMAVAVADKKGRH
jgi:DNA-binding transcriptional MerR regulator